MVMESLIWSFMVCMILYANVFPCKGLNGLVWLCMVLYGLTQLCTIFVLVFMTVYTNIFLHKFRIYKIENTCYSLEMVKRATFLEGTETKFIYNLGIFWLDTFGPQEVKIV